MNNDTFTTQDLIDELQAYHKPTAERREGGVSAAEWAEAQNISTKTARKELKKMMDDGLLVREKTWLAPRAIGWVYYRAEK
jgi:predicted transcriptional regulator